MTSRLLHLSRAATLITLVLMAWQVNVPLILPQVEPASLPPPYLAPAVSLAEITALIAIFLYALSGWPNRTALRSGWRRVFVVASIGLVGFALLSIGWSPLRGYAIQQALHLALWAAFAWLIASAAWPAAKMAYAFLIGLLLHSLAGFIQISLQPLVQITPQNSGISVVFNNAQHLLRMYGLSPHPNVLGGHLAIGAILTTGLIVTQPRRKRVLLIIAWGIIWITLLLTFSRSAWLAVTGGSIITLILLWRGRRITRTTVKPLVLLGGAGSVTLVIFGALFQPYLANRFAVTATVYELQAITERVNTAQLALQVFAAHPWTGVGLAQSLVVMHNLTGMPLDWVHNVPLLIASELGIIGCALSGALLMTLAALGMQRWRMRAISLWQALVGGALVVLVIVMQFDHYLWTMPQGGLLGAWLVGWWLCGDSTTASRRLYDSVVDAHCLIRRPLPGEVRRAP